MCIIIYTYIIKKTIPTQEAAEDLPLPALARRRFIKNV